MALAIPNTSSSCPAADLEKQGRSNASCHREAVAPASLNRKRTASLKKSLKTYMDILRYGEESVSVAMEEGKSQDWVEKVFKTRHSKQVG